MRNLRSDLSGHVSRPSVSENFSYSFGAVRQADGQVSFRLWAPGATQVELELEGAAPEVMNAAGEGFYELRRACAAGARYWYRTGTQQRVPDPASRLQDGDVHDASVVVGPCTYDWLNTDWQGRPWEETVLYEIHVGLVGGFRGVQEKLADLADLGITAIELMPIADFPGPRNWGYDGVLPYAPDCAYGTPDELKLLIDTAHGMGLMVFLDVVYNHFGPDGNYLATYAPDFFRDDLQTPWGPAIDFRKAPVRKFFAENALYWLREYRFDGLRLDAVHAISERDWLPEMARYVRDHIEPGRYVHLVLENDDNVASLMNEGFDAQWNDDAHHVLHHILTGETQGYYAAYEDNPTGKLGRVLQEGFVYQGEPTLWRGGAPRGEPSAGLPPSAFVFFLQNHDQIGNRAMGERLISLCRSNPDALYAAVALQLLTPHIPLLFMGEEVGAKSPFLYFTSFGNPELAQAVREGRRKEFAGFDEFADAQARERIPDPNDKKTWDHSKVKLDAQNRQAAQWRSWYGSLLQLRRKFITPHLAAARSDSVQMLAALCVVARWRLGNGSLLSLYCNFSQQNIVLAPGAMLEAEEVIFQSKRRVGGQMGSSLAATSTTATLTRPAKGADRKDVQ